MTVRAVPMDATLGANPANFQPVSPKVHPNNSGAALVANAFVTVFTPSVVPGPIVTAVITGPVYRYIAVDMLTHTTLADLPLRGVRWGQKLNRAGLLRGQLQLPSLPGTNALSGLDNATIAAILVDAVDPLRRAIYVERDGVLVFGGPIWFAEGSSPTTIEVQAADWWSMFAARQITATQTFAAADQLAIARALIAYAQSKPGGDLGITVGAEASGVLRDRTYQFYEGKYVGEAIEQLAAVENGFDFSIDVAYDSSGNFIRPFHCWYPRRGRIAGDTGHVWELGRNIEEIRWPKDGTRAANSVMMIGAGEGESMLRSQSSRPDLFAQGYPLLEASVALKDVSVQATLDAHGRAESSRRGLPVELPPIVVRGDLDPRIGSYVAGDEARIRIEPNTDARWPVGLDTYRRIVEFDVKVDDEGGAEHVTITTDQAVAA